MIMFAESLRQDMSHSKNNVSSKMKQGNLLSSNILTYSKSDRL